MVVKIFCCGSLGHGPVSLRREGQGSDMVLIFQPRNLACINNKAIRLCKHIKQKTVNVRLL